MRFHFVYMPLHGDGQIVARVVSYQRQDMWTKVGVMVRETTDPGSKFVDVLVTPDKGAEAQWRAGTNGDTQTTDQIPSPNTVLGQDGARGRHTDQLCLPRRVGLAAARPDDGTDDS